MPQCLVRPAPPDLPAVLTGDRRWRVTLNLAGSRCSHVQGLVSGSPQAAAPGARVNLAPGRPARLRRGTRKAEPSPLPAPQAGDSITPALAQWPFISGSKTLVTGRAEREGLIRGVRGRAPGSRAGTSLPISRAFHGNGSYFPPLLGRHSHAAQTTSVKTCRPPSLGLLGKRDPLAP